TWQAPDLAAVLDHEHAPRRTLVRLPGRVPKPEDDRASRAKDLARRTTPSGATAGEEAWRDRHLVQRVRPLSPRLHPAAPALPTPVRRVSLEHALDGRPGAEKTQRQPQVVAPTHFSVEARSRPDLEVRRTCNRSCRPDTSEEDLVARTRSQKS